MSLHHLEPKINCTITFNSCTSIVDFNINVVGSSYAFMCISANILKTYKLAQTEYADFFGGISVAFCAMSLNMVKAESRMLLVDESIQII